MVGKIIRGISGFYYVSVVGSGIYECKAKGIFRKNGQKPLVGDDVEMTILDEEKHLGNVEKLLARKSELIRPAIANVDQALVIFSVTSPEPNFNLLDRFLIAMEAQEIPVHICFNKTDLCEEAKAISFANIYEAAGYPVHFLQAKYQKGIDEIFAVLKDKTTTVAGPSGVGKSTLINALQSEIQMETGSVSEKIGRGKHTTRHAELIEIDATTFIADTPGFSSLYLPDISKEELRELYPEFLPYAGACRFLGCSHTHEPECKVKEAVSAGKIANIRYENYLLFYEELAQKKSWE